MRLIQLMAYTGNWNLPTGNIDLLTEDVHVWSALLDVEEDLLQILQRTLDADERLRAGRFYFELDRARFIASHGLLRTILGSYMHVEPGKLRFSYNSQGKPYLAEPFQGKKLEFNMSHSHEIALFAVTFNRQVGVDLEHVYLFAETDSLADRILSQSEKAAWRKYSANNRLETLFRYWTCKEAYVKATGEGLRLPLEKIHISPMQESEARIISINHSVRMASRWSLQELHPVPGFAAALVVEGFDYRLNHWQWPHNWIHEQDREKHSKQ
ncbi:MAG TPA: 4'-phosphopantetheinyl transferase superfamily protein [Ktedonobacteraceae bacterium]|nr:4'-phosphopantetheinyl transferase superfamily protein [Ktedonobacteraceae bacterium]